MPQRRSSRALVNQPSNASQHTVESSSSSTTSGRAERHTRSHTKASTPQKAATPRSRTSEELSTAPAPARGDQAQGRRPKRKRGAGAGGGDDDAGREDEVDVVKAEVEADAEAVEDEVDEDDEEVTRCICGQLEYPGPPFPVVTHNRERGAKDDAALQSPVEPVDAPTEEPGSLFIQCDTCKVWQHGGCVGIMDVSMSPDEYFCELCRRDLHSIVSGPKGQRSSRYLPVLGPTSSKSSPSASIPKESETKPSRSKSGAQAAASHPSKRRSTMNSRDAAYDEEEQLRRAIEESKAEKGSSNTAGSDRDAKRSRSDSQDVPLGSLKRQRTNSHSAASGSPTHPVPPDHAQMDDDGASTKNAAGTVPKRGRAAAARKQQEKELRDQAAERTRGRAEAAEKRKGRADRRRAEGSEAPSERPMSRTGGAMSPPESIPRSAETRGTPRSGKNAATNGQTASTGAASRKPVRAPAASRRGRIGRNQYTRDPPRDSSNARSQSRDGPGRDDGRNGHGASLAYAGLNGDSGRPSKPRYMNPNRTTMNEMKRRVAAILEFISRIQVEMAGEKTPPTAGAAGAAASSTAAIAAAAAATTTIMKSLGVGGNGDVPKITLTGGDDEGAKAPTTSTTENGGGGSSSSLQPTQTQTESLLVMERDFSDLSSLEMMDVLTRKLVLWQKDYGKYGDK